MRKLALFAFCGANDFAAGVSPSATAENIRGGIIQLRQAGARAFVVITVPDISLTPTVIAAGGSIIQAAKQFVFTVNSLLEVEILPYAWSRGVKIDLVDINQIFTQLVLDPARFGFSNSTGAAYNPGGPLSPSNPVSDPNDYVFWDGFHPTTKAHHIAAEYIYRTLSLVSREDHRVRLSRP